MWDCAVDFRGLGLALRHVGGARYRKAFACALLMPWDQTFRASSLSLPRSLQFWNASWRQELGPGGDLSGHDTRPGFDQRGATLRDAITVDRQRAT